MTSKERVLTAFAFRRPDRIPRFDSFWDLTPDWEARLGPMEDLSDVSIWCPDEGTLPVGAGPVKSEGGWTWHRDAWGRLLRGRDGAYFEETVSVPIPAGTDPDRVAFDPPGLDRRFAIHGSLQETGRRLARDKGRFCVFGKTGGPYLRTTYVRGEEQFLLDIAGDPPLARALAEKMADHLIGVAREELKRWDLGDTGIWIYDDMAHNGGPMFSPASFEKVFLPAYRRMIAEYRKAGARYVVLHSDGNILPILDMLVDAGIDGLNPLERRAGMDAAEIRGRHPRLVLIGGMCNTQTLPFGTREEIEREARGLIDMGREGGLVIGTHSISPEVPLASFEAYHRTCRTYGDFSAARG